MNSDINILICEQDVIKQSQLQGLRCVFVPVDQRLTPVATPVWIGSFLVQISSRAHYFFSPHVTPVYSSGYFAVI